MNDYISQIEDESPYEYDKPSKPMSFQKISKVAIGLASAAASVTIGLQIVGPAMAGTLFQANPQEAAGNLAGTSTNQPLAADVSGSNQVAQVSESTGITPKVAAVNQSGPIDTSSLSSAALTSSVTPPASNQIKLPSQPGAPTFGNVSSATPSGGTVAHGGTGSNIKVSNAYEVENESDSDGE
jgi:hypothetical protein